VERTKVMRISKQPSPVQIETDQKQQKDVTYFNYFSNMKTEVCNIYTYNTMQNCHGINSIQQEEGFPQAHWT